ncbi:MAG: hypothetical protein AMJ77_03415, partial [Dehalococcoidia bacterium SM23_28_2]
MRRKDGSAIITEHTVTEIVDDSGQRTGLVRVVRDVTERKRAEEELTKHREHLAELVEERTAELQVEVSERRRAEQALRESEEQYRAIFEQAADSIVLIDAETGAFVEFNDRAHQALGYSRQEFEKRRISDFDVIQAPEEVA